MSIFSNGDDVSEVVVDPAIEAPTAGKSLVNQHVQLSRSHVHPTLAMPSTGLAYAN